MNKSLSKLFALLLCVAILVPAIERNVHLFKHRNDIHCNSSEKHFHTSEHNCSICDYTIPLQEFNAVSYSFNFYPSATKFFNNYTSCSTLSCAATTASRAPPLSA